MELPGNISPSRLLTWGSHKEICTYQAAGSGSSRELLRHIQEGKVTTQSEFNVKLPWHQWCTGGHMKSEDKMPVLVRQLSESLWSHRYLETERAKQQVQYGLRNVMKVGSSHGNVQWTCPRCEPHCCTRWTQAEEEWVSSSETAELKDLGQRMKDVAVAEMTAWILKLRSKGLCEATAHLRS